MHIGVSGSTEHYPKIRAYSSHTVRRNTFDNYTHFVYLIGDLYTHGLIFFLITLFLIFAALAIQYQSDRSITCNSTHSNDFCTDSKEYLCTSIFVLKIGMYGWFCISNFIDSIMSSFLFEMLTCLGRNLGRFATRFATPPLLFLCT